MGRTEPGANWLDQQVLSLDGDARAPTPRTAQQAKPAARINGSSKRAFDCILALALLCALAPLMTIVAILIKLETPGPVFFRQERRGLGRTTFRIYKFRTMRVHAPDGAIQAKEGDARITPIGSVLRRCSLDELPQLINVLTGDMSIVGPRPHALSHDVVFERNVPDYGLRFRCRPGLVGLAQLNGARGEIRHRRDIVRRTKLDLLYQRRWSVALDAALVCSAPFRIIADAVARRSY